MITLVSKVVVKNYMERFFSDFLILKTNYAKLELDWELATWCNARKTYLLDWTKSMLQVMGLESATIR